MLLAFRSIMSTGQPAFRGLLTGRTSDRIIAVLQCDYAIAAIARGVYAALVRVQRKPFNCGLYAENERLLSARRHRTQRVPECCSIHFSRPLDWPRRKRTANTTSSGCIDDHAMIRSNLVRSSCIPAISDSSSSTTCTSLTPECYHAQSP